MPSLVFLSNYIVVLVLNCLIIIVKYDVGVGKIIYSGFLIYDFIHPVILSYYILILVGTDTTGCVRVPASFVGVFGYRPSHGAVSSIGVLPNSQSLDTVGMFEASSPTIFLIELKFINFQNLSLFISFIKMWFVRMVGP